MSKPEDVRVRLAGLLDDSLEEFLSAQDLRPMFDQAPARRSALYNMVEQFKQSMWLAELAPTSSRIVPAVNVAPRVRVSGPKPTALPEVAIVVPLGNPSIELKSRCLRALSRNFSPERCLVVLYTSESAEPLEHLLSGFRIVSLVSRDIFSLPVAYNNSIAFLRQELGSRFDDVVLTFMDDDAEILGDQSEIIARQLQRIKSNASVLTSGHYYDLTPANDAFSSAVNASATPDFVARVGKPYCHGGAALMMRGSLFPNGGLPNTGLGGISLGVLLMDSLDDDWVARVAAGDWYLFNEARLFVQHPRKPNLLQWSVTYLGYTKAWGVVLGQISDASRQQWQSRLRDGKARRRETLARDAMSGHGAAPLGNLLLTDFFKPKLFDAMSYDAFRSMGLQVHANLQ
jgi:hypothetical protein